MMRKSLWIIALVFAAIGAPSVVRADPTDITYTVSETVGAGNVTGFITTNGTMGLSIPPTLSIGTSL